MPRRLVLTFIALGFTMALTAAPVAALGTLDQQHTNQDNSHFVFGGTQPAQVFTAGIAGQLDHVDLFLGRVGDPGDDLTVEIWGVAGGTPASPVPGASATVLLADIPQGDTWIQVPISAPSVVGTQYAIVLSAPAAVCDFLIPACLTWHFEDGANPYTGGDFYTSTNGGANWAPVAGGGGDAAFGTYVTVPPAATPVMSNLPNAAMDRSADTSPLWAIGLAALLIGSLGTLAFANARRR